MRARAPASSANLGPGFDALAVAVSLHVEVTVESADALAVVSIGEGADLPRDERHLAAQVVRAVTGHDGWRITVASRIPVSRGLGSSAALAVAAAAAAGAPDPLAVGADFDGHPENAAASAMGGLVAATTVDGRAVARQLTLDPELAFVVVIPDRHLATKEARGALPPTVPHSDAAFNLSRMGVLIAGLADAGRLTPAAMQDRLHQQQRGALFPEAARIIDGLVAAGALGACWSGAGPTLLGLSRAADADELRRAGEHLLQETGLSGRAEVLAPDLDGLVVGD